MSIVRYCAARFGIRVSRANQNIWSLVTACFLTVSSCVGVAQFPISHDPPQYGPYNGIFLSDGMGLRIPLVSTYDSFLFADGMGATDASAHINDSVLRADSPWTLFCWFETDEPVIERELVGGLGNTTAEYPRYLAVDAGKLVLWMGEGNQLSAPSDMKPGEWHLIAATFDGRRFRLYSDGRETVSGVLVLGSTNAVIQLAPSVAGVGVGRHFGGRIASFTLLRTALSDAEIRQIHEAPPNFSLIRFEEASKPWPFQTRGQAGYRAPQDPSTLPKSRAPFSRPSVLKRPPPDESLVKISSREWTFSDGWTLREQPKVDADGAHLSTASEAVAGWMRATVPGTVLTTMVDDGVYPDPDFDLNNMAIPESLNKQDYWYRNEFNVPNDLQAAIAGDAPRHIELTFQGINYKAEVWLNGTLLGSVKGAFQRGVFDVTLALKPGQKNVLAVRISPPPHPGIPQEASVLGGPGENGGAMELDGPTFLATEGWDWIPAIRDRNAGIWQPVTLRATRGLKLGDAQVVTSFHDHNTSQAAVEIDVPIRNFSERPTQATLSASIEQISLTKTVVLVPGNNVIKLIPAEFSQLNMQNPRLWWPNGYGKPELYHLKLAVRDAAAVSDTSDIRFGVREVTYELSLLDNTGHLRRVEFNPTAARGLAGVVVDVSHKGMREIPSADAPALNIPEEKRDQYPYQSYVASLAPGAERSPSLESIGDEGTAPYLVIKVNGVRIAARGGNWGMDDSRKRVSRTHLEPYFRLHRDANLNLIRNWVGQNTEETFYDLADEYGMLVWNDFWESTQNYNIEAEDPELFLANASDTIKRFRNHPSIVIWCGRNEGVPQPILNAGLDELVRKLDGTRYYSPSSNQVNLQNSGPYSYQKPALYYSTLNRGFSVETGTPSMSTLESLQSTIAKADQWPIGDAWAYHDWHQSGNGNVAPFMAEMEAEFGAPTGLDDFERKAQMLNYVDHRAIFEGMNANLWQPNSGRLLWMTQPAWPSTMWQIFSSDYDTQASFYGVKKACEPVHVQLNLATYQVDVINTTTTPQNGMSVSAKVYSLANALLYQTKKQTNVDADSAAASLRLDLTPFLERGMLLVELELQSAAGKIVSQNLYWIGAKPTSNRELTHLASVLLKCSAFADSDSRTVKVYLHLTNTGTVVSLANKLTLYAANGKARILPVYYSDNYISLLPGQNRDVEIEYPSSAGNESTEIAIRGWNAVPQTVSVKLHK
jgi:hypothetical protein